MEVESENIDNAIEPMEWEQSQVHPNDSNRDIPAIDAPANDKNDKIRIQFKPLDTNKCTMEIAADRSDGLISVLGRFTDTFQGTAFEYYDCKRNRLEISLMNLYLDEELVIFYKTQKGSSFPKSTVSFKDSSKSASQSDRKLYLNFVDKAKKNNDIDLTFDESEKMSTAIEQISTIMELNESNSHFFNSKGTCRLFDYDSHRNSKLILID